jgi:hypothetical protein
MVRELGRAVVPARKVAHVLQVEHVPLPSLVHVAQLGRGRVREPRRHQHVELRVRAQVQLPAVPLDQLAHRRWVRRRRCETHAPGCRWLTATHFPRWFPRPARRTCLGTRRSAGPGALRTPRPRGTGRRRARARGSPWPSWTRGGCGRGRSKFWPQATAAARNARHGELRHAQSPWSVLLACRAASYFAAGEARLGARHVRSPGQAVQPSGRVLPELVHVAEPRALVPVPVSLVQPPRWQGVS